MQLDKNTSQFYGVDFSLEADAALIQESALIQYCVAKGVSNLSISISDILKRISVFLILTRVHINRKICGKSSTILSSICIERSHMGWDRMTYSPPY